VNAPCIERACRNDRKSGSPQIHSPPQGVSLPPRHRTLLVRLPEPSGNEKVDNLALGFARVPWEIAIAPGQAEWLLDRNCWCSRMRRTNDR
jgi:hypothetical protein